MNNNKIYLDEITSTNSFLKELCKTSNIDEGTIVWTDFQTAGRGQKGNVWESEVSKNLLFSIVLYPHFLKINEQFIISQAISLAIKDVLDEYIGDICIKWPNDIYWKNKKICGILIENELMDEKICFSIIGIGININQQQFVSDAPNPVSLRQITGQGYNRETILNAIQEKILAVYNLLGSSKKAVSERYKQSLYRQSGYFGFRDKDGEFKAQIKDVTDNGFLILQTEDGIEKQYAFKEVRFI